MIYYTADLHIGHANIIKYCNRPFETVEEMDQTIIDNWNSVVREDDDVYIVGDVFFKGNPNIFMPKMKGRKHLIVGNHDANLVSTASYCKHFETIKKYLCIEDKGRHVVLFHYPILEWSGYYHGTYHVYGHIHNNDNETNHIMTIVPNAFNAAVDVNDFTPQTLDQLIARHKLDLQN